LNVLQEKTQKEKRTYLHKLESLYKEKTAIREKALKEAKRIMDGANKKVEKAVQQIIEEKKNSKKNVQAIRSELEDHKNEVSSELLKIEEQKSVEVAMQASKKPPKVGDFVRFLDGSTHGELIELKGKQAVVQTNGLRLKTTYKNLVRVQAPKAKKASSSKTPKNLHNIDSLRTPLPIRLDLRGKRAEQALNELQEYIDKALFRGLSTIELVHGKGDGILKEVVHGYLNERNDVFRFELANEDVGGAGCTIVQLK